MMKPLQGLGFLLLVAMGFASAATVQTVPEIEDTDTSPYHEALLDYKSGKYEEARAAIDMADRAKPGDVAIGVLKTRILIEQGDFATAEKTIKPLVVEGAPIEVLMTQGDLYLRKRSFDKAVTVYEKVLAAKPGDPDITLKLVYAQIGASDLVSAGKTASVLSPLDAKNPYDDHASYYFARAALAQATGNSQEAENEIQTARTLYGITVTNRYLKTYLEMFASTPASPANNASGSALKPAPSGKSQ
jgi:predicted Zn-dependent protease